MRRRFNPDAVASSYHYDDHKKAHRAYLREKHSHFHEFLVDGHISIDVPEVEQNTNRILPQFKTIKVFGRSMRVTIEEYNTYCKELGL